MYSSYIYITKSIHLLAASIGIPRGRRRRSRSLGRRNSLELFLVGTCERRGNAV
jgi:hypothetical protein